MIDIKKIDIEYIVSLFFGLIGFVLSVLLGIFSGNGFGSVIYKSIIFLFSFAIIGYISIFVLKKFVPELYNAVTNIDKTLNIEDSAQSGESNEVHGGDTGNLSFSSENEEIKIKDEDNMLESDISNIEPKFEPTSLQNLAKEKSRVEELTNKIKYEPKIVAQAVRTMMKKDE